jgi:hypothetical protein
MGVWDMKDLSESKLFVCTTCFGLTSCGTGMQSCLCEESHGLIISLLLVVWGVYQGLAMYCFETTSARIGAAAAHSMP